MEPRQAFRVPPDALSDGYNLIEVLSTEKITIKWVEISVRLGFGIIAMEQKTKKRSR